MSTRKENREIKHPKIISLFSISFLIGVLFFSCIQNSSEYRSYQAVQGGSWKKENPYQFTFDVERTDVPYHVTLLFRTNDLYPYRNLWLHYQLSDTVGTLKQDTLECILADEHGKWLGKGISLFEIEIKLPEAFRFTNTGETTFRMEHCMRKEVLEGMELIGLDVRPH